MCLRYVINESNSIHWKKYKTSTPLKRTISISLGGC